MFLEKLLINIDNRNNATQKASEQSISQFKDVSRKSQD